MNIWRIGLTENMDIEDRKRLMFSNGVYIIVASILMFFEIITGGFFLIFQKASIQTLTPFLLIGFSCLGLVLNAFRFYMTSRVLFFLCSTFLVSFVPVIVRGPTPATYFTHSFYIIIFSPVIHVLFSQQKERYTFYFFLAMSLFSTMFSIDFLLAFDHSPDPHVPIPYSVNTLRTNFVIIWLFINLLMAYVQKTNWSFYQSLQEQKELTSLQQRQLLQQNEDLSEANLELISLNEKVRQLNEELEKRVGERTNELTDRNKTLSDYAFMNAHLLRSPVSRIKGLINLFSITNDTQEKIKIQEILVHESEELDKVIHSISQKLNEVK